MGVVHETGAGIAFKGLPWFFLAPAVAGVRAWEMGDHWVGHELALHLSPRLLTPQISDSSIQPITWKWVVHHKKSKIIKNSYFPRVRTTFCLEHKTGNPGREKWINFCHRLWHMVNQESLHFIDMFILQDTKSNLTEEIKNSTRNYVIMTIF